MQMLGKELHHELLNYYNLIIINFEHDTWLKLLNVFF